MLNNVFMNLGNEYKDAYEQTINAMLEVVCDDDTFTDTIRHLCNEALDKNWDLEKKLNIINVLDK